MFVPMFFRFLMLKILAEFHVLLLIKNKIAKIISYPAPYAGMVDIATDNYIKKQRAGL